VIESVRLGNVELASQLKTSPTSCDHDELSPEAGVRMANPMRTLPYTNLSRSHEFIKSSDKLWGAFTILTNMCILYCMLHFVRFGLVLNEETSPTSCDHD
jgi:hypothetical protein